MGLDNFVVYNLPKDGVCSLRLSLETVQLFKHGEFLSARSDYVTFCGKCYNTFFEECIGATLYKDLEPKDCQEIYKSLKEYLADLCAISRKIIDIGEQCWMDKRAINKMINNCIDFEWFRHPSYDELLEMLHLFKTCAEHNLSIYASY